jgi:ubiquinone/menaquinone biosynthesis C-methylase UbiE
MKHIVTTKIYKSGLKFLFNSLYHSFAQFYDFVAWIASAGLWDQWINTAIPFIAGPKILEIGFGPGHLLEKLVLHELIAFGLDESQQMARMAIKNLNRSNKNGNSGYPDQRITRGKSEFLPYPSECFNSVVSTFPSPYILNNDTFLEIERVLVPGGKLVVVIGARLTGKRIIEKFSGWLLNTTHQSCNSGTSITIPLQQKSFQWQEIEVILPSSRVYIIHATKI